MPTHDGVLRSELAEKIDLLRKERKRILAIVPEWLSAGSVHTVESYIIAFEDEAPRARAGGTMPIPEQQAPFEALVEFGEPGSVAAYVTALRGALQALVEQWRSDSSAFFHASVQHSGTAESHKLSGAANVLLGCADQLDAALVGARPSPTPPEPKA